MYHTMIRVDNNYKIPSSARSVYLSGMLLFFYLKDLRIQNHWNQEYIENILHQKNCSNYYLNDKLKNIIIALNKIPSMLMKQFRRFIELIMMLTVGLLMLLSLVIDQCSIIVIE